MPAISMAHCARLFSSLRISVSIESISVLTLSIPVDFAYFSWFLMIPYRPVFFNPPRSWRKNTLWYNADMLILTTAGSAQ
jgi:hypothetical protein